MSDPVFVCDAGGTPLMPMSPALARKLIHTGRAHVQRHHAFTIVQLEQTIPSPNVRPIVLGVSFHLHTAELFLLAEGETRVFPLLYLLVDLHTDLPRRIRRRRAHRRRRHARGRYRPVRRHRLAFKLRRPGLRRSRWGSLLRSQSRSRRNRSDGKASLAPTIRWRTQAVERVIAVLRKYVPISHMVLLHSGQPGWSDELPSPYERRQQLIEVYGKQQPNGERVAVCAYCETTTKPIVVDHIIPQSRGGTNTWGNVVLACKDCNEYKGDHTPEEAGMTLKVQPEKARIAIQRSRSYCYQTAIQFMRSLTDSGIKTIWKSGIENQSVFISPAMRDMLLSWVKAPHTYAPGMIVKPVSRPRKQVYESRSYPKATKVRPPFERVHNSIKRRVRVNRGLAFWYEDGRMKTCVVGQTESPPEKPHSFVMIGMLCEAKRAGKTIVGIVSAIHSSGRLALLVPEITCATVVRWQRIVVSPRQHLRILSTDRVLFFPIAK